MTREKRRLGQGLAALLGSSLNEPEEAQSPDEPNPVLRVHPELNEAADSSSAGPSEVAPGQLLHLHVDEIDDNPFQPRREFSEPEIASLAESLKEHDMLQPVLVRRIGERYQLISGERRLRAAIQAGWATIPARVREADDRLVAELAIVENLQRQDLNPIEKALSFRRYLDEHQAAQDDLAKRLKIDRSTIANLLRLLELPDRIQQDLGAGKLTAGHARALLPLGDEDLQTDFARKIQAEGLSVRATERLVSETIHAEDAEDSPAASSSATKKKRAKNDQVAALERDFRVALGTKVDIRLAAKGRGQIVISFANHDEFERLREYILDDVADVRADVG